MDRIWSVLRCCTFDFASAFICLAWKWSFAGSSLLYRDSSAVRSWSPPDIKTYFSILHPASHYSHWAFWLSMLWSYCTNVHHFWEVQVSTPCTFRSNIVIGATARPVLLSRCSSFLLFHWSGDLQSHLRTWAHRSWVMMEGYISRSYLSESSACYLRSYALTCHLRSLILIGHQRYDSGVPWRIQSGTIGRSWCTMSSWLPPMCP